MALVDVWSFSILSFLVLGIVRDANTFHTPWFPHKEESSWRNLKQGILCDAECRCYMIKQERHCRFLIFPPWIFPARWRLQSPPPQLMSAWCNSPCTIIQVIRYDESVPCHIPLCSKTVCLPHSWGDFKYYLLFGWSSTGSPIDILSSAFCFMAKYSVSSQHIYAWKRWLLYTLGCA